MKLVTADLMRQIDRKAIDERGIPGPKLMENAGEGIADAIISDILPVPDAACVMILCGKGNNGGDGFVVGRYLAEAGADVSCYFIGPAEELSPDAKLNYGRVLDWGIPCQQVRTISDLPKTQEDHVVVDAIFGTGFSGTPRGIAAEMIEYINSWNMVVVSVDLPSGLDADTGQHKGVVVKADFTYTLGLPKYGLYVSPGREMAGKVKVIAIGIPDDIIDSFDIHERLITQQYVAETLPERKPDGHKGTFGKVLIVGGSTGLTGAAALAAESALRTGCGLAKVGCPRTTLPIIAGLCREATTMPLPDVAKKGVLALRGLGEIRVDIDQQDAVIIGPGIGRHHETADLVRRLLDGISKPVIIDADGLNAIAGHLDVLEQAEADIVLTPHPGEFQRLSGKEPSSDIHELIATARDFAIRYQVVLVLKGSPTVVADVDGTCYVNQTGNDGMGTGGTGDVLSGMIGSFLAQGMEAVDAAACAVYLHGLAGDIAADEIGKRSLIAGDLVDALGDAFLKIEPGKNEKLRVLKDLLQDEELPFVNDDLDEDVYYNEIDDEDASDDNPGPDRW